VGSQIDLSHAAKMACMSIEEISRFNPGFQRGTTDPDGPYELLVPLDKASKFQTALNNEHQSERVTWTRYVVKQGETLFGIAKKFNSNATLLKEANHLKSRAVHPGQTLLIPSQKNKKTTTFWPSNQPSFSKLHANLPEAQFIKYTVKADDTVDSIAEKLQVKSRELRFWNGLKASGELSVGKELIAWPPRKHEFKQTFTHKVHFGDTITSIAGLYHVTPEDLRKANHLEKKAIHVGQPLIIPSLHYQTTTQHQHMLKQITAAQTKKNAHGMIRYHVKSGDSLRTITKKFHISTDDLKRWNKFTASAQLRVNEVLIIYK
jgi:membrane-bound lytic murein transglycosylase D